MTYQIEILNPKAAKLLKDLADLNLIAIKENSKGGFIEAVSKLRKKAAKDNITLTEITKEVEAVRAKRHAGKKGQS